MWFKYGLKAQKLLAQGIAFSMMAICKTPVRAKALCFAWSFKAFALTIIFSPWKNADVYYEYQH